MNKSLVIIPTFNEKDNIERILGELSALNFDILVVDDNSPDGTGTIVENIIRDAPGYSSVNIIHRSKKLGLGTAYISGFKWAIEKSYNCIFTMDADFSHNPAYLNAFAQSMKTNDLVIGSRYVNGGGISGWPIARKIVSYFGNYYARKVAGLPIKDCTSGFMGIRAGVLNAIGFEKIVTEGYAFLLEIKYLTHKGKYRIEELPIVFTDRKKGKSKISKKIIFEAFLLALKLRFIL